MVLSMSVTNADFSVLVVSLQVGDTYLDAREFIDIDDLEARELGDFLWD